LTADPTIAGYPGSATCRSAGPSHGSGTHRAVGRRGRVAREWRDETLEEVPPAIDVVVQEDDDLAAAGTAAWIAYAIAYRRRAWGVVGGLDEASSSTARTWSWRLRLRAARWSIAAVAEAVAFHIGSSSMDGRSGWQRYQGGFARGYSTELEPRDRSRLRSVTRQSVTPRPGR